MLKKESFVFQCRIPIKQKWQPWSQRPPNFTKPNSDNKWHFKHPRSPVSSQSSFQWFSGHSRVKFVAAFLECNWQQNLNKTNCIYQVSCCDKIRTNQWTCSARFLPTLRKQKKLSSSRGVFSLVPCQVSKNDIPPPPRIADKRMQTLKPVRLLFTVGCLATACFLVAAHDEDTSSVHLTKDNFATELDGSNYFVMFFAPWWVCFQCFVSWMLLSLFLCWVGGNVAKFELFLSLFWRLAHVQYVCVRIYDLYRIWVTSATVQVSRRRKFIANFEFKF